MDGNLVESETHQLVPINCFDLNEPPQEGNIIFILFAICISFIIEYDIDFFFFNSFVTIAQIDDDLIASEIHGSVSRNCVELNEFSNDGKNNNTCGEKIIDWNECPIDETEVIEECEDINSIENGFEPFVGQCFLSEEEAFNFYKNYANRCGFTIRKGRSEKKNGEIARRNFFCHREGRQPLKIVDPSKEQRNRKSLKCGCKAHLTIVLRKSVDIIPRKWHVTMFVVDYNHELLSPLGV